MVINAQTLLKKPKFSIKDFFSQCDQTRSFLRIWTHLLKKSLMEIFFFCAVKFRNQNTGYCGKNLGSFSLFSVDRNVTERKKSWDAHLKCCSIWLQNILFRSIPMEVETVSTFFVLFLEKPLEKVQPVNQISWFSDSLTEKT